MMRIAPRMRGKAIMPWLAAAQLLAAPVLIAGLAVAPPASGRMLLMPLTAEAQREIPRAAIAARAALVARGPIAGSLIVSARRDALVPQALAYHFLIFAAGPAGCSPADPA